MKLLNTMWNLTKYTALAIVTIILLGTLIILVGNRFTDDCESYIHNMYNFKECQQCVDNGSSWIQSTCSYGRCVNESLTGWNIEPYGDCYSLENECGREHAKQWVEEHYDN